MHHRSQPARHPGGCSRRCLDDSGFTGDLTADGGDPSILAPNRVIVDQVTVPASEVGVDCLNPGLHGQRRDRRTTSGTAAAAVPRANMINLRRAEGEAAWIGEGFADANFDPQNGGFTIKSQSVVGGTYLPCTASVSVSANPGAGDGHAETIATGPAGRASSSSP